MDIQVDKVLLCLDPERPLFIFSVVLRAAPAPKTVGDVSTVRTDVGGVHLTITQERYAPDILRVLWARYGRGAVYQQTRFDIDVRGATESELSGMVIATGEEDMREIIGAIWRTMPEGIKNRKTLISGNVITVVATEEILLQEMIDEGKRIHTEMGGSADV